MQLMSCSSGRFDADRRETDGSIVESCTETEKQVDNDRSQPVGLRMNY
jgi:hypothetical protein